MLKQNSIYLGGSVTDDGILPQYLALKTANRHGLITGATGTGKTATMQIMAEGFSRAGVPVFVSDVKGDLSGIAADGTLNEQIRKRLVTIGFTDKYKNEATPTTFWDIYGDHGHAVRTTISTMGPTMLARLLGLNNAQKGALYTTFKIAAERSLPLITMDDLQNALSNISRIPFAGGKYGTVSTSSLGAIQRQILVLEMQGAKALFGQPTFDVLDLLHVNENGRGTVNVMAADKLMSSPSLYSTFLLWMLSDLYERLPEVGDLDKPKLIFFFDEAHLLFDGQSKALLQKVEQIVRMIRSKSVGIYFVTQVPDDIPETILEQLGNRVQHALRAYTPRAQRSIRAAAETLRPNPDMDIGHVISEMITGEALVSTLNSKGVPSIVQRTMIRPPSSQIGPIDEAARRKIIDANVFSKKYAKAPEAGPSIERAMWPPATDARGQRAVIKPELSAGMSGGFLSPSQKAWRPDNASPWSQN